MRAVLFALVLLVPLAGATPPSPAYTSAAAFSAPPYAERPVEVTISIVAHLPLDARLRLEVPAWVAVEGEREWEAKAQKGERIDRSFRVTPTREGLWHVGLSVGEARSYGEPVEADAKRHVFDGCCAVVLSMKDDARHAPAPQLLTLPDAHVDAAWAVRAKAPDQVEVVLTLTSTTSWARFADLRVQWAGQVAKEPAAAPATFTRVVSLASGNATYVTGHWDIVASFQPGDDRRAPEAHVGGACEDVRVERVGDEIRVLSREACGAAQGAAPRRVPAAPFAIVVLMALAAWRKR